jgi:AcrR family transcriptional regulator
MLSNIVEKSREKYLLYEKRHHEIFDAAIRLFNAKGYRAATTAEIAKEAGISEPTMYKHFQNKKDLFLACFRSICEQLLRDYSEVYKENRDDEVGYIKGVTKVYVDFVENNPHKSMFLVHLLGYRDEPEFENVFTEFMARSIEGVKRVLESAKKKGRLKSKVDVHVLACFFVNQYFTVVASREFLDQRYFSEKTYFQLMKDLLGID